MPDEHSSVTDVPHGARWLALRSVVKAVSSLLCLFFILTTIFYVTPNNPMKLTYGRWLGLFGRYFGQNWKLFAPDPLTTNMDLYVQCSPRPYSTSSSPDRALQWRDVSGPLWRKFHDHRFGAYDRLARPIVGSLRGIIGGDESLALLRQDCARGEQRSCKEYELGLASAKTQAGKMLGKVATAFCEDVEPDAPVRTVSLRLIERPALPWSKRNERPGEYVYTDIGTYPAFGGIDAPGVWRAQ